MGVWDGWDTAQGIRLACLGAAKSADSRIMSNAGTSSVLTSALRSVGGAALDLVFPRQCWACGDPLARPPDDTPAHAHERFFCTRCHQDFPRIEPPYCDRCGEPYDLETDGPFRCWNCTGRRFGFEFAVSGYQAAGPVREMVHRFKYGRELAMRGALATLLREALVDPRLASENLAEWCLVPVPLHRSREFEREFNQAWELCEELARCIGATPFKALIRTQATQSQASLDRRHRLRNLRGVFALQPARPWRKAPDLKGRKVLLVDDVLTTGATTHECARVLKRQAGVEKVVVITVARG